MSRSLISVIIPAYNAAKYLSHGLDSLLSQTCGDWEALCIDDGSSDNSLGILEEYAHRDSRFRVLKQENSGVSVARNRGIKEARGEWVTFLDADDWLSSGLVEKLLSCPCTEQVDIIGFEAETVYEEGVARNAQLDKVFQLKREGEYPVTPDTLDDMVGTCWGKVYRRDFLIQNELEFPLGMRQEDEVFYRYAMGVARHVYLLKHMGYHYLQVAESYMHQHTDPCESYMLYLKGMQLVNLYYQRHGKSVEWTQTLLSFLYKALSLVQARLNIRQTRELQRHTQEFMKEIGYAGLDSSDYRVRFLSVLPWWEELVSYRGWGVESFKLFGITYRKDYYRDFKLSRRTTPWLKIRELFSSGNGNTIL